MRCLAALLYSSLMLACGAGVSPPSSSTPVLLKAPGANGDQQTFMAGHPLPQPLRVLVTSRGRPLAGAEVRWQKPGGDTLGLSPLISTTQEDGIAATRWVLGTTPGYQTVEAWLEGAEGSPVRFTARATTTFPFQILGTAGDNQIGVVGTELDQELRVIVGDEFGNPVSGVSVGWAVTMGEATIAPSRSQTGASGAAAATVTLGPTAGTIRVIAATIGTELVFTATAVNP